MSHRRSCAAATSWATGDCNRHWPAAHRAGRHATHADARARMKPAITRSSHGSLRSQQDLEHQARRRLRQLSSTERALPAPASGGSTRWYISTLLPDGRPHDPCLFHRVWPGNQHHPLHRSRRETLQRALRRASPSRSPTPASCRDSGPTVASRTAMIVGKLVERAGNCRCSPRCVPRLCRSYLTPHTAGRLQGCGCITAILPKPLGTLRESVRATSLPARIFWDDDALSRRRVSRLRLGRLRRRGRGRHEHLHGHLHAASTRCRKWAR